MFKTALSKRANNACEMREIWDKKINYSYKNYLAINAIGEIRLNLFCLLVGVQPTYRRQF